jgi:hypothetical protein
VSGVVSADSAQVRMPMLSFANAFVGPPTLARWLLANGCRDVMYRFHNRAAVKQP